MQYVADMKATQASGAAIEIDRVSHVYAGPDGGVPALSNVSMKVGAGRFVVIVGPSGCGKTSLLMMLAGLRRPSEGAILCAGHPIPDPDPNRVGVVFQEASLFPWLTALDNVEFPLAIKNAPREERRRRAQEMLALVGLDGFGGRYPHELSGGMQQRVGVARVLANHPEVMLMDEPFASIDAQTRMKLQEDLTRIWEERKPTIFFVTHDVEEAIFLSDRVIVLSSRPSVVTEVVDVQISRPRKWKDLVGNESFHKLRRHILSLLGGVQIDEQPEVIGEPGA